MKQEKNIIRSWIVLGILLVCYNVVVFFIPFRKNAVFAVSWLFSMLAIAAQIYVIRTAFCNGKSVKSKFYGFPIAKLGVGYLAVQLVLSFAFMALGLVLAVPVWLPLVLYVVLLGAAAVGLIAAEATRDVVNHQEVRQVKQTARMRGFQAKARGLADQTTDPEAKQVVVQLEEALRYSDPVSSDSLIEIEDRLEGCLEQLSQAITQQNTLQIVTLAQEAQQTLAERNRLCKLGKK